MDSVEEVLPGIYGNRLRRKPYEYGQRDCQKYNMSDSTHYPHLCVCCHRCGRGDGVIVLNTGFVRCSNESKNCLRGMNSPTDGTRSNGCKTDNIKKHNIQDRRGGRRRRVGRVGGGPQSEGGASIGIESADMELDMYRNETAESELLEMFPTVLVSHHHVMVVITSYLALVKVLGPWMMSDRKPFQLKKPLLLYNVVQILMNCYLLYLYSAIMGRSVVDFWGDVCRPASAANSYDPKIQPKIIEAMYYYYVNKIIDLVDTIFITLRKKQSQITFLHLFHHTTMVLSTWLSIIYIREEASVIFAGLNATVHIIMYVYYLLSSLGPSIRKFLWWKKYITSLQIGQFLVALSVLIKMKLINCKSNPWFWLLWTGNIAVFLALFLNFYIKSYIKKKKIA